MTVRHCLWAMISPDRCLLPLFPFLFASGLLLTCCLLMTCSSPERGSSQRVAPGAGAIHEEVPDIIDPQARYLFYLHGQIVEDQGLRPEHPQLGIYEYEAIRDTLAGRGLVVISEARPASTDIWDYAQKVKGQVERLLAAGVPAGHITVAGHSKGGAIAILVSSLMQNDRLNYIFLACCGDWMASNPNVNLSGRILSIYDVSDPWADSCQEAFDRATRPLDSQEITLDTGKGHGAFYRPMSKWVGPVAQWALAVP